MDLTKLLAVIEDTPGAYLDKAYFEELRDNLTALFQEAHSQSTFNGTAGREITIANPLGLGYTVNIQPLENPNGYWWAENNSNTQFTVYNSNSAQTTAQFDYYVNFEKITEA